MPRSLTVSFPEHDVTLSPDYVVVDAQNDDRPLMFVTLYPPEVDLGAPVKGDRWATSRAERMVELCRARDVRLGLVTNGERWMLVDAPPGGVASFASWYSQLWGPEPVTLQSFINLLGIRRFFVDDSERLPRLLDDSLKLQDDVTDALGEQVRRAVEVLVQAIDRADVDRNRDLLAAVEPLELYEASLTVMMRIVFLLCAEERGMLLLDDESYQAFYAVSTLRMQLRAESDEILERRQDAWSRLLAIFRAVYGGIVHEALSLPALGGSLFDPDRFPFLEGRAKGTNWKTHPAAPLPIDNRTVLLLLDAVQLFQGRPLSYRALDIEQIGYVYEGLLERTVIRAPEVTIDLAATKNAKTPWVTLHELEIAAAEGQSAVQALLKDRTGSSASRVKNQLLSKIDDTASDRLLIACHGDKSVRDRIRPYLPFLRVDPWGYPLVYPKRTFMVTGGADRRETGTHYTPKSLTETIVKETLEPLVYIGPTEGQRREDWTLREPCELLDLKICDPAMGSGAFLVQVCRWLSERLVEAWAEAEATGKTITAEGDVVTDIGALEPLRTDPEERMLTARRLIAEQCLYGVDMNPLAVELAKLSIWLITVAKDRPFGFLDPHLRCGDSLLGIHDLQQLIFLDMAPRDGSQKRLFARHIEAPVERALRLRAEIRSRPIRHFHDLQLVESLSNEVRDAITVPLLIADALIAEVLAGAVEREIISLSIEAADLLDGPHANPQPLLRRARQGLQTGVPNGQTSRRPFHWPLEFPEVFQRDEGGFDAFVGNPPFTGGRLVGRRFGIAYQEYLKIIRNDVVGSPDLCTYFFLRAFSVLRRRGNFGLLATKSIAETGTRTVCLDQIMEKGGTIYRAFPRLPWPGKAAVVVSIVWVTRTTWKGPTLLANRIVTSIDGALDEDLQIRKPRRLNALKGRFAQGQDMMGRGFELTAEEREAILAEDPNCIDVIFPLFNGQDLNTMPTLIPYRWVIYFRDWPEERARLYAPAFRRLERLVKPYRESLSGQIHQDCFWKFWDLRPVLMRASLTRETVFASAIVTTYVTFRRVPMNNIYTSKTKLYFIDRWAEFAALQSSLHQEWAFWNCGTLGASTLNYSTSYALETWPMPRDGEAGNLEHLGEEYHDLRETLLANRSMGLTRLYNCFHDATVQDREIERLRDLRSRIDLELARIYGLVSLDLGHGFHEMQYLTTDDNIRFTISGRARVDILRRVSDINLARFEEEAARGARRNGRRRRVRRRESGSDSFQFKVFSST